MSPLTDNTPKVLLEVNGKPMLHRLIDQIKLAGIEKIGVVVNYKKEVIADYIKRNNLNVTLISQKEIKGTGNAIYSAKDWIGDDYFLCIMGDNILSGDLKRFVNDFENSTSEAVYGYSKHISGVLEVMDDSYVYVSSPENQYLDAGLMIFSSKISPYFKDRANFKEVYEIGVNEFGERHPVSVLKFYGHTFNINTKEDLDVINNLLKNEKN